MSRRSGPRGEPGDDHLRLPATLAPSMRELIDLARSRGHGVVAWNETLRCQCRHMVRGPERRVAMDEHLLYAGLALCVADGWLAGNDAALVALRLAPTFHGTLDELCAVVAGVLADPPR